MSSHSQRDKSTCATTVEPCSHDGKKVEGAHKCPQKESSVSTIDTKYCTNIQPNEASDSTVSIWRLRNNVNKFLNICLEL
jgi:pyrimidine deaminase RibD-like protein